MTLALVFNHHSLPFSSQQYVIQEVGNFIKTVRACANYGFNLVLVDETQDSSLFGVELTQGYYFRDWFNWAKHQPEQRELLSAFRSLQTRRPLLLPEDEKQTDCRIEVGLIGAQQGLNTLLAAFWYKTFLISFSTSQPWNQPIIDVWVLDLDDNSTSSQSQQLFNLFDNASLQTHAFQLKRCRDERLTAGKDIWNNRDEFFPYLQLLENQIGNALKNWSHRNDILTKARDALVVMNDFVRCWRAGDYQDYQHQFLTECGLAAEVSGESPSVSNDSKKRSEREFWLPAGVKVYCEYHVKLPSGFRMHFYPHVSEKIIYVVYLGSHLVL